MMIEKWSKLCQNPPFTISHTAKWPMMVENWSKLCQNAPFLISHTAKWHFYMAKWSFFHFSFWEMVILHCKMTLLHGKNGRKVEKVRQNRHSLISPAGSNGRQMHIILCCCACLDTIILPANDMYLKKARVQQGFP